jgi:hypothetical protein
MNHSFFMLQNVYSKMSHQWFADFSNQFSHTPQYLILRLLLVTACLLQAQATAAATDPPSNEDLFVTVATALKNLDATNLDEDWYFTMAVIEGEEHQVIQSDPHRDKYTKRQLISVNGAVPGEEHLATFHDKEIERIDAEDPDAAGYEYMIDVETLQFLDAGDGYARFSFLPRVKALENSRDKIRGSLLLNTTSQQIDQIEIINTAQLFPAFSVTVDTFRLTMKFQPEQGEQVLSKLESDTAGKAGFVKSFDVQVVATFSDYKRATAEPASE